MNDENPTRLVRTEKVEGNPADGATRTISPRGADAAQTLNAEPATRIISGYARGTDASAASDGAATASDSVVDPHNFELAVGWLVVTDGPGKGVSREIYYGMNSLGRSIDERISLDFGDTAISREGHAFIVFDEKQSDYYVQHGGKSNLVRLNGAPVIAPQPLSRGDIIEIGGTKLMFVPLCDDNFSWEATAEA
ncbi:MAG: FHA domain-containing protein [Pseudomonadota bacterium]